MSENNLKSHTDFSCDLYVCMGKHCRENFSEDVYKAAQTKVKTNGSLITAVHPIHCLGHCGKGANIMFVKNGKATKFENVLPRDIDKISQTI